MRVFNYFHFCMITATPGCRCPDRKCIMATALTIPIPTRWSTCSVDDLNDLIRYGRDTCLYVAPLRSVSTPSCGNGIREDNETCDCGSQEECTDHCCNAMLCQLIDGAECSVNGSCCSSQCIFQPYGTECRTATSECDLPEYCLGDSGECPPDNYRMNGALCSSNAGYCYNGNCPTLLSQCQAVFGEIMILCITSVLQLSSLFL